MDFKEIQRMIKAFLVVFNCSLGRQSCESSKVFRSLPCLKHFTGLPPTKPLLSIIKEAGLSLITESRDHISLAVCFNPSAIAFLSFFFFPFIFF